MDGRRVMAGGAHRPSGTGLTEAAVTGSFDYSAVDEATASEARALAEHVRSFERRITSEIIQLGESLLAMKERLGHGNFGSWVEAEFGDKQRTAQRYMKAAGALADKSDTVSYLPPTALYALAAAPDAVRAEIVTRIEAGERVGLQVIQHSSKVAAAQSRKAAKLAKLSPEERRALEAREKRKHTVAAREQAKWAAEKAARIQAAADAVDCLEKLLGGELPRFSALVQAADWEFRVALSARVGGVA